MAKHRLPHHMYSGLENSLLPRCSHQAAQPQTSSSSSEGFHVSSECSRLGLSSTSALGPIGYQFSGRGLPVRMDKLPKPGSTGCCHTHARHVPRHAVPPLPLGPARTPFSLRPLFSFLTAWLTVIHSPGLSLDTVFSAALPQQSPDLTALSADLSTQRSGPRTSPFLLCPWQLAQCLALRRCPELCLK